MPKTASPAQVSALDRVHAPSATRLCNIVRSLFPLEATPGVLSLLAGKPNPTTFPFTSLNFTVRSPTQPGEDISVALTEEELAKGLQYSETCGIPTLCGWINELQSRVHGRHQGEGWRLTVGSGSQDLINKVSTYREPLYWSRSSSTTEYKKFGLMRRVVCRLSPRL